MYRDPSLSLALTHSQSRSCRAYTRMHTHVTQTHPHWPCDTTRHTHCDTLTHRHTHTHTHTHWAARAHNLVTVETSIHGHIRPCTHQIALRNTGMWPGVSTTRCARTNLRGHTDRAMDRPTSTRVVNTSSCVGAVHTSPSVHSPRPFKLHFH